MTVICPTCGGGIRAAGPRFCPHCGVALGAAGWGAAPRAVESAAALSGREAALSSRTRSALYYVDVSWRWLVFSVFLGCVGMFFVAAALPLPMAERNTLCWISALGAMFSGAIVFGGLPGAVARRRGNPNALVITVCGWVGMVFTGGVLWLVALAWALWTPEEPALEAD